MPLDQRPLGRSDITVPNLCLGTMMYGEQIGRDDAFRQMDRCFERGITFFDTAELYTIPPKPETHGNSERIVGEWIRERGVRDRITLATKIAGRSSQTHLRHGTPPRVTKEQIDTAVAESLERLQTDYLDLYQIHWPDRQVPLFGSDLDGYDVPRSDDAVPVAEQLEALSRYVEAGTIRTLGLSNETPWGVMAFLRAAEQHGLPRMVSIQNAYSLVNRTFEYGLAEIALEEDVGLLAYSPLGQGALSGKYLGGQKPKGSRGELFGRMGRYETPSSQEAIRAYVELAGDLGVDPSALAFQFVTTRRWVTSNIFGARGDDQLDTVFQSLDVDITEDVMKRINEIHARWPNPCP